MGHRARTVEAVAMTVWNQKRVLLTGHTGFKGAWAARWLARAGAHVTGLSLPPDQTPNLFDILGQAHLAQSHLVDLRDTAAVAQVVAAARPEIVLHMAAQPLVRQGYADPVGTFSSNVMGTVHLLDALRHTSDLRAVLVVTSDKVYENSGAHVALTETDRLGGADPYSASKAATEIVVAAMRQAFFQASGVRVATARGGNVVGGGDFSADRLVPDIIRAAQSGQPLALRAPNATRPWQHVLDCLSGYFTFVEALLTNNGLPETLNFGPNDDGPHQSVAQVAEAMQQALGTKIRWHHDLRPAPAEKPHLSIDSRAARHLLGWQPRLDSHATLAWTAELYSAQQHGADLAALTDAQITRYQELAS